MLRIAIADDVEPLRRMLSIALGAESDLEVVGAAADGVEAVELAARLRPDVLLLDVAMPELDGLEALALIRERTPETRVLILTGFGGGEVRSRALAAGAAGYLEKGLAPSAIAAAIRACVEYA